MKRTLLYIYTLCCMLLGIATQAEAQSWDFSSFSDADVTALNADTENWTYDSSNNRWKNAKALNNEVLMANGQEVAATKGLKFTISAADGLRLDNKKHSCTLNGAGRAVTIPALKKGDKLTVVCQSSSSSTARALTPTNLTVTEGFAKATDKQTCVGTVDEDGDVTLTADGGIYIYSITAGTSTGGGEQGGGDEPGTQPADDHSNKFDVNKNQALLTLNGNVLKYYNTEDVASIDINKAEGTVTVKGKTGEWSDQFTNSVATIGFNKASKGGQEGNIDNKGVEITSAKGWLESAYVTWNLLSGASSYNVYVKGGNYASYTKLDQQLVRNYGSYGRADMVGLVPGANYELKVVPVIGGAEDDTKASTATGIVVEAYDRSGFAHLSGTAVGAYNNDGSLKSNARVIYVTAATAKTVTLDVIDSSKGTASTYTGLQAIVNAYQKGLETRPVAIRIVGTITDSDMDSFGSSAEGLQIKGKNNTTHMNITMEGIGEDAGIWGFGILMRNAVSVELRNFAVMLCMDDAVSLDTDNKYCWVHHLDLFYGNTGGDSDQAKGDGTIDVKSDSQYITISYNHFWDSGKSSLCGMKSESGPNYICYHHNWFDHSDSRHPRVRSMSVHVWNNYYDGCSKYGVGSTMGSSVFVESNYFRNTKNPMLISRQGTDAKGDGTFSGENGGVIKSYGNVYAEKSSGSNYTPVTQKQSATDFDCYEVTNRNDEVPSTVKALVGGTAYNNFDTDANLIYKYTPDNAADVPAVVTGWTGAGRMNKGDFQWTFNNSTEDTNYGVISELKTALQNYKSSLKGHF